MRIICNEGWRRDRLTKAAKVFRLVYGISEIQLPDLVEAIEDSKGELVVFWKTLGDNTPTEEQKRAFAIAWEVCGESSERVFHTANI